MEVLKGYLKTTKFSVPQGDLTCLVNIKRDGEDIVAPFNVWSETDEKFVEVLIPYSVVQKEQSVDLTLTFSIDGEEYTKSQKVDVKSPYLELFELEEVLETNDEEECWKVEAAVRHVINSHCGQEFGSTEDSQTIVGNSESVLGLSRPILRLDSLSEGGVDVYNTSRLQGGGYLGKGDYTIIGDGWYIKRPEYRVDSIKADRGENYVNNPIRAPRTFYNNSFLNDAEYVVSGKFGYESVPGDIKEAAKLLVNDYRCGDNLYRDRYVQSVAASDWRLSFAKGAWRATGNARADMLLGPYVVNRIVVI